MDLIADRFLDLGPSGVLDLASGAPIVLERLPRSSTSDETAWALGAVDQLVGGGDEVLVDFGASGSGDRFEARASMRLPVGRIPNQAAAALADAIDHGATNEVRIIAIFARDRVAASALALDAARRARRVGLVPFATHLLTRSVRGSDGRFVPLVEILRGRSLLLLHEGDCPGAALAAAAVASPRPHLMLCATRWPIRGVDTIVLSSERPRAASVRSALRAAEQAQPYESAAAGSIRAPVIEATPTTPSDLAAWRTRAIDGCRMLDEGRHAAGERMLRHAIGGLVRRRDWSAAGGALNGLARALLKRGRPARALDELDRARDLLGRAAEEPRVIDTAILAGRARLQLAKLDEAEATFSAALVASRTSGDEPRVARATAAMANVLLWQGRYAEALELADSGGRAASATAIATVRVIGSLGTGHYREAVSAAAAVSEVARDPARPAAIARAAGLTAFAHLAVGDLEPVARELDEAARAAAAFGDRLMVIRCRLLRAEAARRQNRREAAVALVARLGKVGDATLPPLLRAHVRLLTDLLADRETPEAIAARHAKITGLAGLQLLIPSADTFGARVNVDDVVEILRVCESADDEAETLRALCAQLAARLRAVAVAVYVAGPGAALPVSSYGARLEPGIAERAISAGITIDPHQHEDRIEGAAAIRYSGEVIGALAARWVLGSPFSRGRAAAVLATAGTAAAPLLAVVRAHRARPSAIDLIGISAGARELRNAIDRAATAPFPVLIEGESGSGKELVARALHRRGPRRDRPFATLNCAALPDDLVESELFGHARGSFTGAVGDRAGVFEEAHTGTLFLDEIGELSARAQAKVLRVVQEGELRRVGENVSRRVDVRLVSATNCDLRREAEAGRFRTDLLYRIDVVRISVPPLRERRDDIPLLIEHYWREATGRVGSRALLSSATIAALSRYDWPGNVRELQNVLASLAVRAARRGTVGPAALPPLLGAGPVATGCRLDEARRVFEEQFVRAALVRTGGRRIEAAAELGLTRQGLTKLLARLGISE